MGRYYFHDIIPIISYFYKNVDQNSEVKSGKSVIWGEK